VRFIRRSGLASSAIDQAARRAIAPLRVKVEEGASAVLELLDVIPASEGPTLATQRRFGGGGGSLIERGVVSVSVVREVEPLSNDEALGDRAAEAARSLSVAVCNRLEDWEWGYALIRLAIEKARTPAYVAQLAGEQALVCSSYHWTEASEAAKLRRT